MMMNFQSNHEPLEMNSKDTMFIISLLIVVLVKTTNLKRIATKLCQISSTQFSKDPLSPKRPVIYSRYNDIYKEIDDLYNNN